MQYKEVLVCVCVLNILWRVSSCCSARVDGHSVRVLAFDECRKSPRSSQKDRTSGTPDISDSGYNHSPYPHIDEFVSQNVCKGGVQGQIRRWVYFPQGTWFNYSTTQAIHEQIIWLKGRTQKWERTPVKYILFRPKVRYLGFVFSLATWKWGFDTMGTGLVFSPLVSSLL